MEPDAERAFHHVSMGALFVATVLGVLGIIKLIVMYG